MSEISIMNFLKIFFAASIVFDILMVTWIFIISEIRNKNVYLYFLVFISLIIWEMSLWSEFFFVASEHILFFIDRLDFASGALAIMLGFNFIWHLTHKAFIPKWFVIVINIVCVLLSLLCFIPGTVLISRSYIVSPYFFHLTEGPFLIWYYVLLAPVMFLNIYMFIRAYKVANGIEKMRLKLIGIGLIITATFCMGISIVTPIFFYIFDGGFDLSGSFFFNASQIISGISTSFFSLFTIYAITRYRFMDIHIMLKKSVVYGVGIILSAAAFISIIWLIYAVIPSIAVWIIACILLILFTEPYRKYFKKVLDGIFFLDQLDLSKRVEEGSERLHSTKELHVFVTELVESLQQVVSAEVQHIYITQRQHHRFVSFFPKKSKDVISFDDDMIPLLQEQHAIVVAEELRQFPNTATKLLLKFLSTHHAEVLCIVRLEGRILALFFLGKKQSQTPYTLNDTERLQGLIDTTKTTLPILLHWHETVEGIKLR